MQANPLEAQVGAEVEIQGAHWPAGQTVHIKIARPDEVEALPADPQRPDLSTVKIDNKGNFKKKVKIPAGLGWENGGEAAIVVHTESYGHLAVTSINVVPLPPTATPVPPPTEPPPPEQPSAEPPSSEQAPAQ